jgi:hypothetical protein
MWKTHNKQATNPRQTTSNMCGKDPTNMRPMRSKYAEKSQQICRKYPNNCAANLAANVQEIPGKAHGKILTNVWQQPWQYCSKCLEIGAVK